MVMYDVKRECFEEVCKLLEPSGENYKYFNVVSAFYEGDVRSGELTLAFKPGETKTKNEFITKLFEILNVKDF